MKMCARCRARNSKRLFNNGLAQFGTLRRIGTVNIRFPDNLITNTRQFCSFSQKDPRLARHVDCTLRAVLFGE